MPALNQIFFGPPGTGKTYATIAAALEILAPTFLEANATNREALKQRFDAFVTAGDVRFVTFHQSFSYEDFVEGLRADTDENGHLRYTVVPGVFKSLCRQIVAGYRAFKAGDQFGKYRVSYASADVVEIEKPNGKKVEFGMNVLNGLASHVVAGDIAIQDIRDKSWDSKLEGSAFDPFIVNGYQNLIPAMVEHIIGDAPASLFGPDRQAAQDAPTVLIIDEINRGNVSRIFGEIITLIEPSKRAGAAEALEVVLPYSKDRFSVPATMHIIGTMNTADRSLASMDIALRRRFTFIEVPPNPQLLEEVEVESIAIDELLSMMNARIVALLDRDHSLGHAYFMPLQHDPSLERLECIFKQQILPLLQEYFFDDWQRIQWVLNDQRKAPGNQLLIQPPQDFDELFGDAVNVGQNNERWELNLAAFKRVDAYLGIIDHTQSAYTPNKYDAKQVQWGDVTFSQSSLGSIAAMRNGQSIKPVKPLLREAAAGCSVSLVAATGNELNTRRLGRKVIQALIEQQA